MDARAEREISPAGGTEAIHRRSGSFRPQDTLGAGQPDDRPQRAGRTAGEAPCATVLGGRVYEGVRPGRRRTPALAAVAAGVPLASALRASLDELRPGHRADLSRRGRRLRRDLPRLPRQQSLVQLQKAVDWYKNETLEKVGFYRMALRFSQAPTPIRRLLWWGTLNISGYKRCKRFGTFGLSSYGSLGAEQLHPISPLTTTLTYGPIDPATRPGRRQADLRPSRAGRRLHRPPAPRHRRDAERPDPRGTPRRTGCDDRSVGRIPTDGRAALEAPPPTLGDRSREQPERSTSSGSIS